MARITLGIYLPTYRRSDRLQAIVKNLKESTYRPYKLYLGVEPDDLQTQDEADWLKIPYFINEGIPSFSNALQTVYEHTRQELFLAANDDFHFLKDWDKAPVQILEERPSIMTVGLHDGNPNTGFATIHLIRRKYIKEQSGVIDMPNRVFYPYHHNYVDTEFTETAQKRGVWAYCLTPCIEHRHPSFKWLGEFPSDEVNGKNDASTQEDASTFFNRRHLWQ